MTRQDESAHCRPDPIVTPPSEPKRPLVRHIFTADPSAHVFDGRLYVYPSHDLDEALTPRDDGAHFDMKDYHVLSMDRPGAPVLDHGVALHVDDVPWATCQMWAPDAARVGSTYYLYFPAKNREGIFQIGVATSQSPTGPFRAEPKPIAGSYSIDPAVFVDRDGQAYMIFGGIWGGQLQNWETGSYDPNGREPSEGAAICPRIARLSPDMLRFREPPRKLIVTDAQGTPLAAADKERRYFEGPWMHEHDGLYYFSYSTGDTHYLVYATADSPLGPFTYRGRLLQPVVGWTTHHSTVKYGDQWYLFYHDSTLSGGDTSRRCVKMQPFSHEPDGTIRTLTP